MTECLPHTLSPAHVLLKHTWGAGGGGPTTEELFQDVHKPQTLGAIGLVGLAMVMAGAALRDLHTGGLQTATGWP